MERTAFDDEAERKKELAAERARQQQERLKQVGGLCARGGVAAPLSGRGGAFLVELGCVQRRHLRLGPPSLLARTPLPSCLPAHAPPSPVLPPTTHTHTPLQPPPLPPQAYEELKTTDKAKDMREQQLLRSQLDLAYKTGDRAKAETLAALLAPTALADIGKVVRPPASGT